MLKLLTTATCEEEADILLARLAEAGIQCVRSGGGGLGRVGFRGPGRDVLVEQGDLPKAKEVLAEADSGFDEAELTRLSMEAGEMQARRRQ